jgi:hypothetical protein
VHGPKLREGPGVLPSEPTDPFKARSFRRIKFFASPKNTTPQGSSKSSAVHRCIPPKEGKANGGLDGARARTSRSRETRMISSTEFIKSPSIEGGKFAYHGRHGRENSGRIAMALPSFQKNCTLLIVPSHLHGLPLRVAGFRPWNEKFRRRFAYGASNSPGAPHPRPAGLALSFESNSNDGTDERTDNPRIRNLGKEQQARGQGRRVLPSS